MIRDYTRSLQLPFSEATLADHLRYEELLQKQQSGWSRAIASFLRADNEEILSQSFTFPSYEVPNVHRAIAKAFPEWRLAKVRGQPQFRELQPPKFKPYRIRPDIRRSYLNDGSLFFELPNGDRRIVAIREERCGYPPECCLLGPSEQRSLLEQESRQLIAGMRRHHYLRRQAIRPDGSLLSKRETLTWNDIALPAHTIESLQRNVIGTLERRRLFRTYGIPQRRGILLHGRPGTGKTMIGKVLASLGMATFIWVTAADIEGDAKKVRNIFKLARTLRPTILFFEDLDFHASDRKHLARAGVLGELLCQMDGLESNDGLIVVATTNDLAAIEPAIKDRPSRFDVVLEIGLPDWIARRQIIEQQFAKSAIAMGLIDNIASATDGMTGAQVRETVILVLQEAIFREAVKKEPVACPPQYDIQSAIQTIRGHAKAIVGFASIDVHSHPTLG